ncbi:MAG TPA: 1,2-phenylacetyl-CoA epoxidase subunit PaaC, partial [Candidatus Limnocylindria bacterium]|nr:1,2-phenylacetyl-CoA epoxidase subunit PaaC [Candidatus Limnocylindria bacterium]
MSELDRETRDALAELLLAMADDEFVLGFWDSEWTGIAPILEEDVAMSSVSQDEIGHAKALYELLAELTGEDPDQIAFGRPADAYRHAALMNHARTDWAFSIARRFLYENADAVRLESLDGSSHQPLAGLAAKMRREETYHLLHFDLWLRRLAEGGSDSRGRLAEALETLWPDSQAVFAPLAGEACLLGARILPESLETLRARWLDRVVPRLEQLGLPVPSAAQRAAAPTAEARTRRTPDFEWLH